VDVLQKHIALSFLLDNPLFALKIQIFNLGSIGTHAKRFAIMNLAVLLLT
jgi:hypothetical protein